MPNSINTTWRSNQLTWNAPLEGSETSGDEAEKEAQVDGEGVEVAVGAPPPHEGDLVQEEEVGRHVDAGSEPTGRPAGGNRGTCNVRMYWEIIMSS